VREAEVGRLVERDLRPLSMRMVKGECECACAGRPRERGTRNARQRRTRAPVPRVELRERAACVRSPQKVILVACPRNVYGG
jgi:hypothetical protein